MLDHPEWRGKPVIVGGSADKRGVVSTASYEARVYGVHSAMPSYQARRLCPDAIWTHGHFDRYREMSDQVMALLVEETPKVEQVSIDEAFFDVTPGRYSRENPVDICRRIQSRVSDLGVTCSIGIGANKTIAKIASERDKPRGLTVVMPGTEAAFLAPLPVRAMSGIGGATERRLDELGIHTLGQLAAQDPDEMERLFGVSGPRMVVRAAGREASTVANRFAEGDVKSVSNERTFATDLTTREEVRAAVRHVAALTGTRLRKKGLRGSEVTLKLKFDVSHTRTAQRPLPEPTDDEHIFGAVALDLLDEVWREGTPVRLVGVGLSGFDGTKPRQMSLFDDEGTGEDVSDGSSGKRDLRKLSLATDLVREKFGSDAVAYGHDLRFRRSRDDRSTAGSGDAS